MKVRPLLALTALLLAPASARSQDPQGMALTEEEARRQLEGDLEAQGLVEPPGPPETLAEKVDAVRYRAPGALEFARDILATGDPGQQLSVLRAMGRYDSQEALDLLRDQAAAMDRLQISRESVQGRWAQIFRNRFGERADALAIAALEDPTRSDLEKALHLVVLCSADRDLALAVYRPYLEHPSAEVRFAALKVNTAHWDSTVLPILLDLENGDDPAVRKWARYLTARYLRWGDSKPDPARLSRDGSIRNGANEPHDAEGLEAWKGRSQEWARQQYILIHGEQPPAPAPEPEVRARLRSGEPIDIEE